MSLNADQVYGFANTVLFKHFDNPRPTPEFHKKMWELLTDPHPRIAIAAPRSHAKSTAGTFAYGLASVLFRDSKFVVILSATESLASEHLKNIYNALVINTDIQELFNNGKKFIFDTDTNSNIIVRCYDGHKFRIVAKGAEQKIRGLLWSNVRPDLLLGDDMEEDEQVLNQDRREKFRRWFFGAVMPCLSIRGKIRVFGTILHFDSLLMRLMSNSTWKSALFRAHDSNFENILWPEQYSIDKLMEIRQGYAADGNLEGYSQEYLNNPIDESSAFFKVHDLCEIKPEHKDLAKEYYVSVDLAISKDTRADYTVFSVAGVDPNNRVFVENIVRDRLDTLEIIDMFFELQTAYDPAIFFVETEKIEKAIGPVLQHEMYKRGIFLNIKTMVPTKDKVQRARALQARIRAKSIYFDKDASWYPDLEEEILHFPKGKHDDQVDSLSWLGIGLNSILESPTREELDEDEYNEQVMLFEEPLGMSAITGY